MKTVAFSIWRGDQQGGGFTDYEVEVQPGFVVLDAVRKIQAEQAHDMAIRWNCKAGKCGSCSMEINGKPKLACMNRMSTYDPAETITVQPLKTFPVLKDLVCDVSFNYEKNESITPFTPPARDADEVLATMVERGRSVC